MDQPEINGVSSRVAQMAAFAVLCCMPVLGLLPCIGQIVEDTNVQLIYDEGTSNVILTVYQNTSGDYTSAWLLHKDETNLVYLTSNADESSDWYMMENSEEFTSNVVATGNLEVVALLAGQYAGKTTTVGIGEFFLGVNTGIGFGESNRSVFGWAHLVNFGCQVAMVDNAVSYGGEGIVIGEPGGQPGVIDSFDFPKVSDGSVYFTNVGLWKEIFAKVAYTTYPCREVILEVATDKNPGVWEPRTAAMPGPTGTAFVELGRMLAFLTNDIPVSNSWMNFRFTQE